MILRQMASNIKNRDWSSVLIEIMVVVVGILIGLQIDDWNEARKSRRDESEFLHKLHEDLLLSDQLSQRVRHRRLNVLSVLMDTGDVLFRRSDRDTLTAAECAAIAWSSAFNVTAPALPSVDELVATGRMDIIRDSNLRSALVALSQSRAALGAITIEKSTSSNFRFLPGAFPDLLQLEMHYDTQLKEVISLASCDVAAMRANRAFLTQFSANVDGYDAFLRDGLAPWSSQSDKAHAIVDNALGVHHEPEAGP